MALYPENCPTLTTNVSFRECKFLEVASVMKVERSLLIQNLSGFVFFWVEGVDRGMDQIVKL